MTEPLGIQPPRVSGDPDKPGARHGRIDRRRLLLGLSAAGVPALAGRRAAGGSVDGGARRVSLRQVAASPVATPRRDLVEDVVATPSPSPTGKLEVVRDPRPVYAGEPVAGGELQLQVPAIDAEDFSPVAFRQDFQVLASHLDPLVWVDEVTMEPRPWLAERWEWSDEETAITYTLRSDVRWQDGERLTAADVVFSLFVARDDLASGVTNLFALMEYAEAVDDRRVKVTLTAPDGGWLLNASTQFVFQRKQYSDYWQSRPEGERTLAGYNWRENPPVGTGPWKFDEQASGRLTFSRYGDYWAGAPHAETLIVSAEPDVESRIEAWLQGETHVVWPLPVSEIEKVRHSDGRLYVVDSPSVMFAAFNFDNPMRPVPDLLSDVRVRQAISLVVDRDRYAREIFGGFFRPEAAGTIAQPWAHDPESRNPPHDLNAARALLAEAGWKDQDGDGTVENPAGQPFEMVVILRNDARPELQRVLRSVAEDLSEAGIRLAVQPLAPDRFDERWKSTRDFDLIAYAYTLYPGFTDFDLYGSGWDIRVNPQGFNPGGYRNRDVDEAVAEILREPDLDRQRDALYRLQRAANEDLFGLWLGFPQDLVLVRPEILGFQPHVAWPTWGMRSLWFKEGTGS